jgi:hypothetical protein
MKNSIRTGIAVLTLTGAAALAPISAASADPIVNFERDGAPVSSGATGSLGQVISISADGCTTPAEGDTTYMGQFVALDDDPLTSPSAFKAYEVETPDGNLTWDATIPMENDLGTFTVRWFCAPNPVESLQDPSILWTSPPTSMTIVAPEGDRMATSATAKVSGTLASGRITMSTAKQAPSSDMGGSTLQITTDVDALPAVDKMDIPGAISARLKKQVDAKFKRPAATRFQRTQGRAAKFSNKAYVAEAFKVTTGRIPSAKTMKPYVAALDAGAYKVQVVEQIALTAHDARWWIRRG